MLWPDGSRGLTRPVNPSSLSPWASPSGTPGGRGKSQEPRDARALAGAVLPEGFPRLGLFCAKEPQSV